MGNCKDCTDCSCGDTCDTVELCKPKGQPYKPCYFQSMDYDDSKVEKLTDIFAIGELVKVPFGKLGKVVWRRFSELGIRLEGEEAVLGFPARLVEKVKDQSNETA